MLDVGEFIVEQVNLEANRLEIVEHFDPLTATQRAVGIVFLKLRGESGLSEREYWFLRALRELDETRPGRAFQMADILRRFEALRQRGLHDVDPGSGKTAWLALHHLEERLLVYRSKGRGSRYWRAAPRLTAHEDSPGWAQGSPVVLEIER